jgi:hypothetical protein
VFRTKVLPPCTGLKDTTKKQKRANWVYAAYYSFSQFIVFSLFIPFQLIIR